MGEADLIDTETLEKIIAEAVVADKLQQRGDKGERLAYAPNEPRPYTGWTKRMYDIGKLGDLMQYKDGAGTRDRTEDTSLEGWGFTTKLCPRPK